MPDKTSTDEQLILLASSGNEAAINALLMHFFNPLRFYILKNKWCFDPILIQEIIHQTILNVLRAIKSGRFKPIAFGLFKSYLFQTCQNTCFEILEKEKAAPKPGTDCFPKETVGLPEALVWSRDTDYFDYDDKRHKLAKALPTLTVEQQRLIELRKQGVHYSDMKNDPILGKYTIDSLREMMYIIKCKIRNTNDTNENE